MIRIQLLHLIFYQILLKFFILSVKRGIRGKHLRMTCAAAPFVIINLQTKIIIFLGLSQSLQKNGMTV